MQKKKILYIITKSNYGGAQRYIYDLATNLPEALDTIVAFGGTGKKDAKPGTLQTKLNKKNIKTVLIKNFMRDMSLKNDILAFFEIIKIIKKEKPNVLHVTSSKAGGLGALAGRATGIKKIIFTSHGLAYDENWRPVWQRFFIWFATWFTTLLSTKTIQITNDTYSRAKKMPFVKNKIVLIHNGINKPAFIDKEKARQKLFNNEKIKNNIWIGTIAELTKNKNLSVLVNAASQLKDKLNFRLFIIGEGEEKENINKIIKEKKLENCVHLPGYINDASQFLKAFDFFVLPSKKEGLPYVLIEAGYAKLPVIVNNIDGIKDIIINNNTGIIIDDIDGKKLSEKIIELVENENKPKECAQNLFTHIENSFSIENMIEKTISLY